MAWRLSQKKGDILFTKTCRLLKSRVQVLINELNNLFFTLRCTGVNNTSLNVTTWTEHLLLRYSIERQEKLFICKFYGHLYAESLPAIETCRIVENTFFQWSWSDNLWSDNRVKTAWSPYISTSFCESMSKKFETKMLCFNDMAYVIYSGMS